MTDTPPDAAEGQQPQMMAQSAQVRIVAQFVRDLSFENPRAPDSLRFQGQPAIELGVDLAARGRPDGLFEVDMKLTIQAKQEADVGFQVELLYGGLFDLAGTAEEIIEPVLLIECPRYLFPFARKIVADATVEGGFAPFLMEPIDFAGVYAAQQEQRQAGQVLQ